MNLNDFVNNYILHDSLIDKIELLGDNTTIVLWLDFAFWMQKDYNETAPETGILKVTFSDVSSYLIPENVNWNEISILETTIENGNIKFLLINDMTDEPLEIIICAGNVTTETILE